MELTRGQQTEEDDEAKAIALSMALDSKGKEASPKKATPAKGPGSPSKKNGPGSPKKQ